MFRIEAEVEKRVVVRTCHQRDIAASAPIAATGPPPRNEFLAPERKTTVAAVAGFYRNDDFVNKHWNFSEKGKGRLITSRPG